MFSDPHTVDGIQAVILAVITLDTLIYAIGKNRFRTRHGEAILPRLMIGMVPEIMSSFLGIGGAPANLVVLYCFFSMDTKTTAADSLYIILLSQFTNLVTTLAIHTIPDSTFPTLGVHGSRRHFRRCPLNAPAALPFFSVGGFSKRVPH